MKNTRGYYCYHCCLYKVFVTDVLDLYMGFVVDRKNLFELIRKNISYHLLYKIIVTIAFSNHYKWHRVWKKEY